MTSRARGFTLLELLIALTLMVLIAGVLFGSLRLSTSSWDAGEERAGRTAQMRMSEELLRSELTVAFPFRWKKMQNQPLAFTGAADSLRFAAPLVSHVGQGGLFWMQLSLQDAGDTHRLVLSRAVPDADATSYPEFAEEDKTILADDIAELKFSYFGPQSDMIDPATQKPSDRAWQDQWVDRRTLPLLVSIEVKPRIGAPWPRLVIEPKMNSSAGCTWDDFHKQCVYV